MYTALQHPLRVLTAALVLGGLAATSVAHAATPSSAAESRGYQLCVDAADREVRVIKTNARYYIYDRADSRQYFLNGYAFRDGDSEAVKIACSTTPSGNRVLEVSVDQGRYAGRIIEGVDVAQN